MAIATGDTVTIEYTGRLDDGTVFDTSLQSVADEEGLTEDQPQREYQPLTVEIGEGRIIEGLEDALVGMEAGDEEDVTIEPERAYGERTDDRVVEYDTAEFTEMLGGREPTEGMEIQTEDGLPGEVVDADAETVEVDFNHELAGKTLTFEVEVVSVE
ncbi:FKBP-type peptidyl-prolyl cis-trans isomerase [Halosimplex salinum]|uniref:FKBP-type peptidyl-prolyl cis-trans isomerase n=1 Tax=Halosimplex salinum TaxID=1710538 RepID=UPI000F495DF6|nr:peptidylprolyl isomerase [Halosimplex salinum]